MKSKYNNESVDNFNEPIGATIKIEREPINPVQAQITKNVFTALVNNSRFSNQANLHILLDQTVEYVCNEYINCANEIIRQTKRY